MRIIPVLLLVAATLPACVYKIDIEQGNFVTQDQVDRLKVGMTKAEVKQALGTPLLTDVFHANRWDYYFSNEKRGKLDGKPTRFTVLFKDDKLAAFSGDVNPTPPPVNPRASTAPAPAPAPATAPAGAAGPAAK